MPDPTAPGVQMVWFKRDLRVQDHVPLVSAAAAGRVLPVYLVEPSLWRQPDAAAQHWGFIRESLRMLDAALRATGQAHARLHVVVGEAVPVLDALHRGIGLAGLHAHEETGNGHSFARDQAVRRWARVRRVPMQEVRQFGVLRGLRERDRWLASRERLMQASCAPWPPARLAFAPFPGSAAAGSGAELESADPQAFDAQVWHLRDGRFVPGPWPDAAALRLDPWQPPQRQRGGRVLAEATLVDFLSERAALYRGGISSPLSAPQACSRLSPHLAYGVLSLREVVQATRARLAELSDLAAGRAAQTSQATGSWFFARV